MSVKYKGQTIAGTPSVDATPTIGSNNAVSSDGVAQRLAQVSTTKIFTSCTVATTAWTASVTYASFPYQATITCTGVTTDYIPEVTFAPDDAISGNFAPVAASTSNGVIIYAKEVPEASITIPTIKCEKLGG